MERMGNAKSMQKRTKYIIVIVVLVILTTLGIISLIIMDKYGYFNPNDAFVKKELMYLDEGESDIYFLESTLYFKEKVAFLEINYDYSYKEFVGTTRFLVNKNTGEFVRGGFEEHSPEFMERFNDTKENYTKKIVYTTADINRLLGK